MDTFIKIAAVAIVGAILSLMLRKNAPETGILLAAAVAAVCIGPLYSAFRSVGELIQTLTDAARIESSLTAPLLKTIGISIICRLAADVCRDASQQALATAVETAGAVTAVYITLPLIRSALQLISSLI